ncbi:hypothetical protein PCANC_04025 [Puccinia coronata f. sp. avenae]|uniref:Uncharacterized protein n=1 Tax=Puccinia coronata f. sp. avenae TaxID=200324 RepID=A0A2N5T7U3_9BASI|nr:hypothetical protein PCANC_04025 [Puccinia coronata f. sp. avenae]
MLDRTKPVHCDRNDIRTITLWQCFELPNASHPQSGQISIQKNRPPPTPSYWLGSTSYDASMDHAHPRNPPGYSCAETLNAESVLIPPEGKRRKIGQHDCNRTSLCQSFGSHLPYTPENDIVGPSSQVGNHQNLESWLEIFCEDSISQETTQHPVESNKINYAPLHNSQINIQHS